MSQSDPGFLAFILRKAAERARESKFLERAADWLGLTEEVTQLQERSRQDHQAEDYSLTKWSPSWFAHRLKPATRLFFGYLAVLFLARYLGIFQYLQIIPEWLPRPELLVFTFWGALRWLAKRAQPQTSALAVKLSLQARGMYWWSWVVVGHHLLDMVITWLWELFF